MGSSLVGRLVAILLLLLALAGGRYVTSHARSASTEGPLERAMTRSLREQGGYDTFKAHVASLPRFSRGPGAGMALTRRGLLRLSAEDQEARLRLVLNSLMLAPTSACAAVIRGNASRAAMTSVLASMDSVSLDAFARIAVRAVLAELRDSPPRQLATGTEVRDFLGWVYAWLPTADAQRVERVLQRLPSAGDDDACWLGRTLYSAALEARSSTYISVVTTLDSGTPIR